MGFLRVRCKNCGEYQIIFDRATMMVKCNGCNIQFQKPKGGKAELLNADIIGRAR